MSAKSPTPSPRRPTGPRPPLSKIVNHGREEKAEEEIEIFEGNLEEIRKGEIDELEEESSESEEEEL